MQSKFSSEFFRGNRDKLRQRLEPDSIAVLTANGTIQRSNDTTFPFAQEKNFWYLTGVDEPDCTLVMTQGVEFLILPQSSPSRDVFDGAINVEEASTRSGIEDILSTEEGWRRLRNILETIPAVWTIPSGPLYRPSHAIYINPAKQRLVARLRRIKPALSLHDLRVHMAALRIVKQSDELSTIRQAISITTAAIDELRLAPQLGMFSYEYELEAALTARFREQGAMGHAYTPIVASGPHATTLHYIKNRGLIEPNHLVVVDVGAEVDQYAADITRTICSTKPTARQQAVLSATKDVHDFALSLMKPGVRLGDYEEAVSKEMGKKLKSLGLISNQNDQSQVRRYYPHATSHFLGLDVHDIGDYKAPLVEGVVLTCEPGIYIPEENIGVRIEDDIVITATGYENLSADCPYTAYTV